MIVDTVDRRTIRAAVELGSHAPSLHNSQPWRWRLDGRNLGRKKLAAGWQQIPFPLPDAGRPIERLTLRWSSPGDGPWARLRAVRLE